MQRSKTDSQLSSRSESGAPDHPDQCFPSYVFLIASDREALHNVILKGCGSLRPCPEPQFRGVGLENRNFGDWHGSKVCLQRVRPVQAISFLLFLSLAFLSGIEACAQVPVYTPPETPVSSPLANVKYDYRWELYGGLAYSHFQAGPNLVQGANLGGFDIQAAHFFRYHWAVEGNVRGYYGTSGVVPNIYEIRGPFVSEYMFLVGPEYRGPSNAHASLTFHALVGGAHGGFSSALHDQNGNPVPPNALGLFNDQFTFGGVFGGAIDLNRSPNLAFRIEPDMTLTNFGGSGPQTQFAISVGVVYRLDEVGKKKRK
jgi:hypothetical protein